LQRARFITDPVERAKCAAGETQVGFKANSGDHPGKTNILVKNATIKNAFNTKVVTGGTTATGVPNDIQTHEAYPHMDTFYSGPGWPPDANGSNGDGWLVMQDTVIKNSDQGLMQAGDTAFTGVVYQNVSTYCESWFRSDRMARYTNDAKNYIGSTPPAGYDGAGCDRQLGMGIANSQGGPVWLINVLPNNVPNGSLTTLIENPTEDKLAAPFRSKPVIIVGNTNLTIQTRPFISGRYQNPINHPKVHKFAYIEDALAWSDSQGLERPPYIELSCSGWRSPPAGCETVRGFKGTTPVN
jgi:hypothetical protein